MGSRFVKLGLVVTALGAGAVAAAQGTSGAQGKPAAQRKPAARGTAGGTSPAFTQACVDLLNGKVPAGGEKAIRSLRKACEGLMEARTAEREAEEEQAAAQREQERAAAAQGTWAGTAQRGAKARSVQGTAPGPAKQWLDSSTW